MHYNLVNKQRLEILSFIILVSLATFSTNLYVSTMPTMVSLFHTNSVSIQASLVSFTYGFAVCMLISGVSADLIGRKKTLLIGLFLYCVTSLSILFCHHLFSLVLLRFLQGVGGCCGTVVARVMVRDQFDDKESIAILALLSSGMAVAFIIAPIVGSFLVRLFSWKACFVMMFLVGFLLWLLVMFVLRETKKNIDTHVNIKMIFSKYWNALQSDAFLMHTFIISIAWTGFFLMMMEYPFMIMTQLKHTVVNFGLIFSIILLGYLLGSRLARQLLHRGILSDQAVFYGITLMLLSSILAIIILSECIRPHEWILALCGFLYLLGMGLQMPNSQFAAIPPAEKGSAMMTSLLYFIEMMVVAFLSNFFKSHFSQKPLMLWVALCVAMGVTFFVFGVREWRKGRSSNVRSRFRVSF